MTDYIILAIVGAIIGAVVWYLCRAKRRGNNCVGCPDAATCAARKGGRGCDCGCDGK